MVTASDTVAAPPVCVSSDPASAPTNSAAAVHPRKQRVQPNRSGSQNAPPSPVTQGEDTSDSKAVSSAETASDSCLSPVEAAVLSELHTAQLLEVINTLKSGSKLGPTLRAVAAPIVNRVEKVIEDQYATTPAPSPPSASQNDIVVPQGGSHEIATSAEPAHSKPTYDDLFSIARVTPLRLTFEERMFLRLLEATLKVSEYTDKVDVVGRWSPAKQMASQIKHICATLSGLVVAHRFDAGQRLIREREFKHNAEFFRSVFEIGRRYKILNPEKMRDSYGKLIYFLMDSRNRSVMDDLGFDCVASVKTVGSLLARKKNGLQLLKDPLLRVATAEITTDGKSRPEIQRAIEEKEQAMRTLISRYSTVSARPVGQGLLSQFSTCPPGKNALPLQQRPRPGEAVHPIRMIATPMASQWDRRRTSRLKI